MLEVYQKKIDLAIQHSLNLFNDSPLVKKACQYALLNGGKRFRPAITLMIAEAIQPGVDVTLAALAIEYFHTASLIADDLPCMDDDDYRRNQPSLHKIYGESMALLTTYALIAEGYRNIYLNADYIKKENFSFSSFSNEICTTALENATFNTGVHGATGGQILDLMPGDLQEENVRMIIHKKTTSLFEVAFVFGWLYSGGAIQETEKIKKAAKHFGLAFQIADDLGDEEQDKINNRKINVSNLFGASYARKILEEELEAYHTIIRSLKIDTPALLSLSSIIKREFK